MIQVFGKVTETDQPAQTDTSAGDCRDACFEQPDCIAAYLNPDLDCFLFDYNTTQTLTVLETARADGHYVSFKTSMDSETCPASQELVDLAVTVGVDTYYWTRTETGWVLKKCMDDWKRFERADNVVVCMQWFPMPVGSSRSEAKKLCEDKGTVLSGVASVEECKWFYNIVLKQEGHNCQNYFGFWIDGERQCTEDNPDCNDIVWSDGYTTGNDALIDSNFQYLPKHPTDIENCLIIGKHDGDATTGDVSCIDNQFACAFGTVCGYKLN